MRRYSKVFAIIGAINKQPGVKLSHKDVVFQFTGGKSNELKTLSDGELKELEALLQKMAPRVLFDPDMDKTRKAIISQFLSIGRTANDAKAWAEKYGVNGVKKKFNEYSGQELFLLLRNAIKVKNDTTRAINKQTR